MANPLSWRMLYRAPEEALEPDCGIECLHLEMTRRHVAEFVTDMQWKMKNRKIDKLNLSDEDKTRLKRLRNKRHNRGLKPHERDEYQLLLAEGRAK